MEPNIFTDSEEQNVDIVGVGVERREVGGHYYAYPIDKAPSLFLGFLLSH